MQEERDLISAIDDVYRVMSLGHRDLLSLLAQADRKELWRNEGARDVAHWVQMHLQVSWWKADRWVKAAHALESLPLTSEALASGALSIDKVVELARFATPRTEAQLIAWAETVSTAAIRHRADVESRPVPEDAEAAEATRFLEYRWTDGGLTLGLRAELPAPEGAAVMAAIEAPVATVPTLPGEEELHVSARRADALVALCTEGRGSGSSEPPPTVVVHVRTEALASGSAKRGARGGVVHPRALERLLCSARLAVQVEEADRTPLALGRLSREPTPAMVRALRYRDVECRFPGCGARRFTVAHHLVWWSRGGRTDLDNLLLLCGSHHKLVHEHGWTVSRNPDGQVEWSYPDGIRYRAGPAPALEHVQQELAGVT